MPHTSCPYASQSVNRSPSKKGCRHRTCRSKQPVDALGRETPAPQRGQDRDVVDVCSTGLHRGGSCLGKLSRAGGGWGARWCSRGLFPSAPFLPLPLLHHRRRRRCCFRSHRPRELNIPLGRRGFTRSRRTSWLSGSPGCIASATSMRPWMSAVVIARHLAMAR